MQYVIGRASRLGNRNTNQDRLCALERDNTVLLVLGDGLGGKAGGEIAAQALVDSVEQLFNTTALPIESPQQFLTEAMDRAHQAVIAAGRRQDPPVSPGTTAVICLVQRGSAWWAHLGDSRLYLFRGGVPIYRTRDHSFVEKLYAGGHISRESRDSHPMKNVMTRCIGLTNTVPEVSVSNEVRLHQGDILLLCSDGLWEPLDDAQMGAMIMDGRLKDALSRMSEQAEKTRYPSSDNISAVAVQIMSLQLVGQALPPQEQANQAAFNDPLDAAIDVIEQTFKLYEHEMK
jgi:serine/threonine protein phosphatase PrpC